MKNQGSKTKIENCDGDNLFNLSSQFGFSWLHWHAFISHNIRKSQGKTASIQQEKNIILFNF